jgi:hypothetical protein
MERVQGFAAARVTLIDELQAVGPTLGNHMTRSCSFKSRTATEKVPSGSGNLDQYFALRALKPAVPIYESAARQVVEASRGRHPSARDPERCRVLQVSI